MNTTSIHTLVHIGAGNGSQLPQYEKISLTRVILIEPLPSQAWYLRQATADMSNAEVWELAVSCQHNNQPAILTEYNLAQASSLHPTTGLLALFPGINALQQHQVTTLSPQELMERLQLNPEQSHQLIVEANGEEQTILNALLDQGQLSLFQHIQIIMPEQALYQSRHNPVELRNKLEKHCFELLDVDNSDPDFPLWKLALNPTKVMLKATQVELQQTRQTIEQLKRQLDETSTQSNLYQEQLTKEQVAHDTTRKEHETLLAQNVEKNNKLDSQLAASQKLIQEQQQQLDALSKNIQTEITTKEKAQQQCDNLTKDQESLQHQIKQLTNECSELKVKDTEQRQYLARLQQKITAIVQEKEKIQQHSENITKERNILAKNNEQFAKNLSIIGKENTEYRQQLADLQQRLQAETQSKEQAQQTCDATGKMRDALAEEKNQLTKEQSTLKDKERQLIVLQKKHAELQHEHQKIKYESQETQLRQKQLETELLKAEAQIELIKELMLGSSII